MCLLEESLGAAEEAHLARAAPAAGDVGSRGVARPIVWNKEDDT